MIVAQTSIEGLLRSTALTLVTTAVMASQAPVHQHRQGKGADRKHDRTEQQADGTSDGQEHDPDRAIPDRGWTGRKCLERVGGASPDQQNHHQDRRKEKTACQRLAAIGQTAGAG